MKEQTIELGQWHESNDLAYMVIDLSKLQGGRGTDILVRGDIHPIHEFVIQLDNIYFSNMKRFAEGRILENFRVLEEVLDTGKTKTGDVIGFKDDRIRRIRRMDCSDYEPSNGPYAGSDSHLEIRHNEQYGGEYPGNPILSSRAGTIQKVLQARSYQRNSKYR